jgi:hypothetical protein
MSLDLSEEDRANLERLERRRMKPTRRQKAIALLRLAAGLSPAEAAKHAGIPKEEVEALATGYAERGLAGVGLAGKPKSRGAGVEEPWRATIPSFRDEALFRQYTEALKARRRDLGPDQDPTD